MEVVTLGMVGVGAVVCIATPVPGAFDLQGVILLLLMVVWAPFHLTVLAAVALAMRWRQVHRSALELRGIGLRGLRPRAVAIAVAFAVVSAVVLGGPLGGPLVDRLAAVVLGFLLYLTHREHGISRRTVLVASEPLVLFLMTAFVYNAIKAAVALRGRLWDSELYAIDRLLLGGRDPIALLTGAFSVEEMGWLYVLLDRVYFAWFLHLAVVFVMLMARGEEQELKRYVGAVLLSFQIGAVSYHLLPALGPVFHVPAAAARFEKMPRLTVWMQRRLTENWNAVRGGTARVLLPFQYIAAMPSLHVAAELIMLFFSRRVRWVFVLTVPFLGLVLASTVLLGWHYIVDWIGGLAVGGLSIWLALRFGERLYALWARPDTDATRRS